MSGNISNLTIELREEKSQAIAGLPYLSLRIDRDVTVAVQLKYTRETVVLSTERLTQMPNVHPCLMGLIEHRSNVFWILDLPKLLGFTPIDVTAIDLHIAILQIGGAFLGLVVDRIGRVLRFTEPEIVSPIELPQIRLPSEIKQFLRGWIAQPQGLNHNLYLLDAEAIATHNFTA